MVERAEHLRARLVLRSGERALLRPLRSTDAAALGAFFRGLSEQTVGLYGPHPFDQATADRLCTEAGGDRSRTRLLTTLEPPAAGPGAPRDALRVVAYFILGFAMHSRDAERYRQRGMPLDDQTDVSLAPVVADAYQSTGVGSLVMEQLLPWLRQHGRRRLVLLGGVRQHNAQAIRFYEKWGMRRVGEFVTSAPNYDMIVDL